MSLDCDDEEEAFPLAFPPFPFDVLLLEEEDLVPLLEPSPEAPIENNLFLLWLL